VKPSRGIKQFVFRYHTATSHFTLWSRCCSCNRATQHRSNPRTQQPGHYCPGPKPWNHGLKRICDSAVYNFGMRLLAYISRISNGQSESVAGLVEVRTFAVINLFQ